MTDSLITFAFEKELMMKSSLLLMTVVIAGISASNLDAADPVAWLPAEINAVARINVAEIYKTPIAKKEGWLKKATEAFVQQDAFIPPGTEQILIGAELDLADNMMARRKYAVLVPEAQLTLEKLSIWLPGGIETISGKKMAEFGNDGYIVDAGDGCWLTTASSSRQIISRWLKNGPMPGGPQLSSYLRSALKPKQNTAQIMLAIDLQDNFSEPKIAEQLKSMDWLSTPSSIETAAKVLESVKGITIEISADTERSGVATVDFGRETAPLKPILDKLIGEVLRRAGISADDVLDWKWTAKGNQVVGSGPVSPGGARRMLSVLDPPSITHAISASASTATMTEQDRIARTSLKYSKSVEVLINDLRTTLRNERDNHAVYLERYGRKIDDLPKLYVDAKLLDFAGAVSSSFRYQAQAVRMNLIHAGTSKQQISTGPANYGYGYGNVGPYGAYNNYYGGAYAGVARGVAATTEAVANLSAQSGILDAQANQANQAVRFSEWKQIEEGLNATRRTMTEKYMIEF